MFKTILKYSAIFGFIRKYKTTLFIIISVLTAYFILTQIYIDIYQYLAEAHPEYLLAALLVKSVLLVVLGLIFLFCLKPARTPAIDTASPENTRIIEAISNKPELNSSPSFSSKNSLPSSNSSSEKIIQNIRHKKKLESRADKITATYEK